MNQSIADNLAQLDEQGYLSLSGLFTAEEATQMASDIETALAGQPSHDPAIRGMEGILYAARNLLHIWPGTATVWRRPRFVELLREALSPEAGLVRVLYFDKPPGNSWALPWHKDLTIAVRDNRQLDGIYSKPTCKAGVPHVEAPLQVLQRMLTARIHLDPVKDDNGPLKVIPGSHRTGKDLILGDAPVQTLHAAAGEVLFLRPLVAHCSNRSHPETSRHRRILHLEFAADPTLPGGAVWHDFIQLLSP